MHINMKYYVVSIGAIFIALGIGILVGFNLNYDQELSKQQATIISDLDKKFEDLTTKNNDLEKLLQASEKNNTQLVEYINSNYDKIIENELKGKTVGVITTSGDYDYTEQIQNTIKESGGVIGFDIVLNDSLMNEDKIKEAKTALNIDFKNTEDVINYIVDSLKDTDANLKLKELESLGMIKVNSISEDYKNYNEVVIASGSLKENKEKVELLDKTIIEKFKQENKYIVAVQKSDVKASYIEEYKESKIATIDNVDEGLGKLSLVTVLKNQTSKGSFGRLEGVDGIIPFK